MSRALLLIAVYFASCPVLPADTVSALFSRGYTVLPTPQQVKLGEQDVEFTSEWRMTVQPGAQGDISVEELRRLLAERFRIALGAASSSETVPPNGGIVRLKIAASSVAIPSSAGDDQAALAEQAYRLTISAHEITITGNSATGLFYGVQTFVQLLKEQSGKLWLPEATIQDWPELKLRAIHWDDSHHLEKLDVLKAAIRTASFYKINGFALKLEGHFEFQHAQAVVDPYALSPGEMQDLTDYALKRHVELIPYLDGPAHDAFILKHPEYAGLRATAESNYEFCATNPNTYQLFEGMFEDLLAATKGSHYFILSTDEPYYIGLASNPQCDDASRAKQLGSVGKLLAEFVTKTASYLHDHGRTVIFWGEYPMKPDDIGALPNYVVNGEVYGPQFDPVFRAHGIRQMVYTSTQGEEQLFPQYYVLASPLRLHPATDSSGKGRVQEMLDSITFTSVSDLSSTRPGSARSNQANLTGVYVAGWADAGLHPETFWLGYATGPAAGWNRRSTKVKELQSSFYSLFYGPDSTSMGRLYELMSECAQFWEDSWDTGPSTARTPIWGDSYTQFNPPKPAKDQFLPQLPVPTPELLKVGEDWRGGNERRLDLSAQFAAKNEELTDLLFENAREVRFNRYNLAVYISIAGLYRQNVQMIQDLGKISDLLKRGEGAAGRVEAAKAVEAIDSALEMAEGLREDRNKVLQDVTTTWYESWLPASPKRTAELTCISLMM